MENNKSTLYSVAAYNAPQCLPLGVSPSSVLCGSPEFGAENHAGADITVEETLNF